MEISYVHANPRSGHESYLLKVTDDLEGDVACFLVDSGEDVDVDDLLEDGEYLAGIFLTHAHLDHYRSLGRNVRDGAPVYAAPGTVRILETVLEENAAAYDLPDPAPALDALEPIEGWERLVPNVEVRPVPAGHAPGAAGFLFRIEDGSDVHHLLASGDVSRRRAAGYPSFSTALPCAIDALFLNVSTADGYEETLTESIETIVERVRAGSRVLLTTSGLTGVKYAYLLAALADRQAGLERIVLAGHVAKLYDDLEYDHAVVESTPVFDDPAAVFDGASVVIAGPEVPVGGSSRSLFREIRDDPGATLVQVTGGASDPVESGRCTVYEFTLIDHPTAATLETIIDDLAPIQLVVEHQARGNRSYRTNENSFVWEHSDGVEHVIYDGSWVRPPWMTAEGERLVTQHNPRAALGSLTGVVYEDDDLPGVRRHDDVDFEAEGLVLETLVDRFGGSAEEPTAARAIRTDGDAPAADGDGDIPAATVDGDDAPAANDDAPATDGDATGQNAAVDRISFEDADGSTPPDPDDLETAALESIVKRLEAIEARLDGRRVTARVVDAGEDVLLLRPVESLNEHFEDEALSHGDTLDLSLERVRSSARSADDETETT